ncbi:MAG: recombinase family protein [Oscillospiraceae bacterium]|nr:recombinase family protein [Oscillospiraceae bacterium]
MDAIYARQSIDKADSISIDSQIEFCRFECKNQPHTIYADKGYSGKNTDRPEFQRMMADIRNGKIHRIVCYKLDRCSRSVLDFTTLMEELQKYDVAFVSCTEKFDTGSPIGRAMLNICIVFAQLERETIQQRVSDAYHSRCKKGFFMGGKIPYGFRGGQILLNGKKSTCYEIHSEEADALRLMYDIYSKPDSSYSDVLAVLKDKNIQNPNRTDGAWIRSHLGRLLRNPAYVRADIFIYSYFKTMGVCIENSEDEFIGTNGCYLYNNKSTNTKHLVLAPHKGIVSSSLWLSCQIKNKNSNFMSLCTLRGTEGIADGYRH